MKDKNFYIVKSSGDSEPFDEAKLRNSLLRAGAGDALVREVIAKLDDEWHEGMSTKSIYKRAFKLLKRLNRPTAARYTLKQALFDFGPSGFPFEDFFAEILKHQGFQVATRQILPGACIQHEVDVVAEKEGTLVWVECKYHPQPGSVSNVKIPLYVHSRFRDLKQYREQGPANKRPQQMEGWIATNTRFSEDAFEYGRCAGLHLVGWNHPPGNGLREMIDAAGLHPVTCLTTLTRQEKTTLLEHSIVLSKDLCRPGAWSDILQLSDERRKHVITEAQILCEAVGG